MTERQCMLLGDLAAALAEVARLRRVERAALSLSACAGVPAHWTADEREGLVYLREELHGAAS